MEGHYDVMELNKTGELDMQVRRILAPKEIHERAERESHGSVKLLEDTDGDGQMDRMTSWATNLPPSYGLVAARQGVIVLCAPDIVYLADRDGDGLRHRFDRVWSHTSPADPDSDDDGRPDGRENPDRDGLWNRLEQRLHTDPLEITPKTRPQGHAKSLSRK